MVGIAPFDIDAAIKKQLDKVPPGDQSIAIVLTGEKVAGSPGKVRGAVVFKDKLGDWDIQSKGYVEVSEHVKPTIGAEIVITKLRK